MRGTSPFGYRLAKDGRTLAPDAAEQKAMVDTCVHRACLRDVAEAANSKGHRARRGTNWRLESLVRVLEQP